MDTTTGTGEERATRARGGGRASARNGATPWRDEDLDLLTAAVLGLAVGVAATLVMRRGPSGRSPLVTGASAFGRGARLAGTGAGAAARRARRRMRGDRNSLRELDLDTVGEQLRDYLDAARGAIEDTVVGELRDLRKQLRRRRRRLGL